MSGYTFFRGFSFPIQQKQSTILDIRVVSKVLWNVTLTLGEHKKGWPSFLMHPETLWPLNNKKSLNYSICEIDCKFFYQFVNHVQWGTGQFQLFVTSCTKKATKAFLSLFSHVLFLSLLSYFFHLKLNSKADKLGLMSEPVGPV